MRPWAPPFDALPVQRPEDDDFLLLIASQGTRLSILSNIVSHDIVVAVFPSHSSQILMPLDVGAFQPLKNSQQKFIRKSLFEGNLGFSPDGFYRSFQAIYDGGFTRHDII